MAFTTWAAMLSDFRDAIANRRVEQWFVSSTENNREMRTTFTKMPNVMEMHDWLEAKASEESVGFSSGNVPFSVGGY
jgi:hypothetical protein